MAVASPNPCVQLFQKYSWHLLVAISDPEPLSWNLYSKKLVSEATVDKANTLGRPRHAKAGAILEGVLAALELRPEVLPELLSALKQYPSTSAVAESMDAECVKSIPAGEPDDKRKETRELEISASPAQKKISIDETVHKEFNAMCGRLGSLVRSVKNIAMEEGRGEKDIKEYLIYSHPYMKEGLEAASTMFEVFLCVRKQCSPVNCTILQSIAAEFHLKRVFDLLRSYSEEEVQYRRKLLDADFTRELQQEMDLLKLRPEPEQMIVLKLNWTHTEDATVVEFQSILTDVFSSLSQYIHLMKVKLGCIGFTCYAALEVMGALTQMAHQKVDTLPGKGILLLTMAGETILDITSDLEEKGETNGEQTNTTLSDTSEEIQIPMEQEDKEQPQLSEEMSALNSELQELIADQKALIQDQQEELKQLKSNLPKFAEKERECMQMKTTFTIMTSELKAAQSSLTLARQKLELEKTISAGKSKEIEALKNRKLSQPNAPLVRVKEGVYRLEYSPQESLPHQLLIRVGQNRLMKELSLAPSPLSRDRWIHVVDGFNQPWGMTVSRNGCVVVTERGDNCITVLNSEGKRINKFGSVGADEGEYRMPGGVAVTNDNFLLIVDSYNHRIQKTTYSGEFLGMCSYEFRYPEGIAVGKDGKIFVADKDNHRVVVLNPDMSFSGTIGMYGTEPGMFVCPSAIAVDMHGVLYVSDHKSFIQKFTQDGKFLAQFGAGHLKRPKAITAYSNDSICVADHACNHVFQFNSSGRFMASFGGNNGEFGEPSGLASDTTGHLFVADSKNDCIQIL